MSQLANLGLQELKAVVSTTIGATIQCGMALREIRDRKLWLEEAGSFQEFCESNWGVSKQRAYQLIDSADVVESLPAESQPLVDSERSARELKRVEPERREAVVQAAASNGPVTSQSIREAAKSEPPKAEYDRTGFIIPAPSPALETWHRVDEIQEMLSALVRIKSAVGQATDKGSTDKAFSEVNHTSFIADISSAYSLLKVALPYAVCPTCHGRVLSECKTCGDRGMVSEFYWKHKVPEETKQLRERVVSAMVNRKGGGK